MFFFNLALRGSNILQTTCFQGISLLLYGTHLGVGYILVWCGGINPLCSLGRDSR